MSRIFREQDAWPASHYARFLWLAYAIWEDILALSELYSDEDREHRRLVISRHLLLDFDSLDELLKEFHTHVKAEELTKLDDQANRIMEGAFKEYHRSVEPKRELLKEIRNNLGAHRTGIPWLKSSEKEEFSPDEWGKWETHLTQLEEKCELSQWVSVVNSAHSLLIKLSDFNLDAWFNISDKGHLTFSMPIMSPGYYPQGKKGS